MVFETLRITNEQGYYLFIALGVLLIFYLVRPKPYRKVIPSLIFLEKSRAMKSFRSFLKRFLKDWLILLHTLIIVSLCLAGLYLMIDIFSVPIEKHTVFVIDASASTQVKHHTSTLFEAFIDDAKQHTAISNTIIVAYDAPQMLGQEVSSWSAKRILSDIKPSASPTNIWDAMMLASQQGASAIHVYSDFISNRDMDTAVQILKAQGVKIFMHNPKEKESLNIGIISYDPKKNSVQIKNFDTRDREIMIDGSTRLNIKAKGIESVPISNNKIRLDTQDDFSLDDYFEIPQRETKQEKALIITQNKNGFISLAFKAMNIPITYATPPVIDIDDATVIVIDEFDYDAIVAGTQEKIAQFVQQGGTLIIIAHKSSDLLKFHTLLPVQIDNWEQANIVIRNYASQYDQFDFGAASGYFRATPQTNTSVIIATANDEDQSSMIVTDYIGRGKVIYFGLDPDVSSFHISTQYPLFWITLLEEEQGKLQVHRTGEIVYGNSIKSPSNEKFSGYAKLLEQGIYVVDNQEVSSYLLNAEESDVTQVTYYNDVSSSSSEQKVPTPLTSYILLVTLVLLLIELIIIKKRGEI